MRWVQLRVVEAVEELDRAGADGAGADLEVSAELGLDEPVVADGEGRFSQEVSYAAVKKHASHGTITATYTHKGKDRRVQIDLGP